MLKFGSPSITLSLLVQNCTVKAGCTVIWKKIPDNQYHLELVQDYLPYPKVK